jgi:phosphohistidine swiveling domain-containing protein
MALDGYEEASHMTDLVRRFNELSVERQPLAGGKGGTLARLYQAGYPVPDGFVIMPAAFAGDELTPQAWSQVQDYLKRLRESGNGMTSFAVRSSALSEDSTQASFAGEFETVLDVRSAERVRDAIHAVRRSRRSERVRAYSQAKGMDTGHDMAVVVQRLVRADMSGVLFTADPVTGSHAHMAGNFVFGFGEELVSGEVEPYTFTLARPKGHYDGPAGLKPFARKLFRLALRLEEDLGCSQDIEWAISGRDLFLLQSRPITTLIGHDPATGEWNDSLTGDYLWSNTNLVEAVPDVMTPSTWSLTRILHFDTATAVMPRTLPVTGNICGRPYLNMSIAISVFRATGMKLPDAIRRVEELFGRLPEGLEVTAPPVFTLSEMLRLVPANLRLEIQFRKRIRNMPEFVVEAPGQCKGFRQRILQSHTRDDLASLWCDALQPYVCHAFYMLRGATKWFDNPAALLRRDLTELVGESDAGALLSNLSSDAELLASLGPVVAVARVAGGQWTREEYLERFGHRGPHEWELSVPQPAEDPDWLDRQLAEFAKSPVDVNALLEQQCSEHEAAWQRFQKRYPGKAKSMGGRICKFAADARTREAVRSEATRVAGVVRTFALRAGELTELGDGIFFLTLDEILDTLTGDETTIKAVAASIPARRETYTRYSDLPPYPTIINGRFDPFKWVADPDRRSDLFDSHTSAIRTTASESIAGFAGAAGRVEGLVRRLHSPEESDQFQAGEILVTTTTNVGWTPLFPRAAAIVTDVGAPLSHAAIVARELGIPAVVGCGNATMRLRSGDRVMVDGGHGIVEILEKA